MATLAELLLAEHRKPALIADCARLIEEQIEGHGTVRRLTLKAGLSVLNSIKPNALARGIEKLLPDFATALEPLYQQFLYTGGADFSHFLQQHSAPALAALMRITDRRGYEHPHPTIRSTYERLRGTAESELRSALPGLAGVIGRHLG